MSGDFTKSIDWSPRWQSEMQRAATGMNRLLLHVVAQCVKDLSLIPLAPPAHTQPPQKHRTLKPALSLLLAVDLSSCHPC